MVGSTFFKHSNSPFQELFSNVLNIADKETGEELTLDDREWRAAGIEVQYLDGRPAPISLIAKAIHVDSDAGKIRFVGFK